ncbi:MAG TPA: response regulator [Polyangiaceae bacterium]
MGANSDSSSKPSGTRPRVARVLVIDDELLVAESLRRVLADEFEVSIATETATALARLTSGDWYDVVLCDIMMPGMNGIALLEHVKRKAPELAMRFIFITGGIVLPHVQTMLKSVSNLVLAKPLDTDAVRDLIRRRTRPEEPGASSG